MKPFICGFITRFSSYFGKMWSLNASPIQSASPVVASIFAPDQVSTDIVNPVSKLVPFLFKKGLVCNNPFRSQFHLFGIDTTGNYFS